tara:strand:- start:71 stop:808 length:738 start_codon:yes stop_codon:yes gene_type:complete
MSGLGLVLTIGKTKEHAITAIQCFNPNRLALVTSEELASTTRRRLTQWKKQFDLDGEVFIIEDLFGPTGPENIMTQTFVAIDSLRKVGCSMVHLGITGGTMHMAGVATSVATMQGMQVFYVKQPDGDQVVQPNKDVLLMPNISAFRAMRAMPAEIIDMFYTSVTERKGNEQGLLTMEQANAANLPRQLLEMYIEIGILEHIEKDLYKLTYAGYSIVKFARKTPNIDRLLSMIEDKSHPNIDHMFG